MVTLLERMNKYSGLSSWAVWGDAHPSSPFNSHSDLAFPQNAPDVLNPGVVFVAMNPGGSLDETGLEGLHRSDVQMPPWSNFHNAGRCRDYRLAEALRDTPFWGGYMTDLFPFSTSRSEEFKKVVSEYPALVQRWIKELEDELADLGVDDPLLLCVGRQSETQAKKYMQTDETRITSKIYRRIEYVPHYSGSNRHLQEGAKEQGLTADEYFREYFGRYLP